MNAINLSKGSKATESKMLFSADSEKIEMNINQDAMAHVIARLTDLYENPVEATVREVVSNAIDSTNMLPKEKRQPIKIISPNSIAREFVVIDKGLGMSHEVIQTVYSQYGASTKKLDMGQVGAYGLGAKAPLSYCSQFTVESTHDGMTVQILISSEETGNYTRVVSNEFTGKENGTRVSIPVRETDIYKFEEAIRNYNSYLFNNEVNIVGIEEDESMPLTKLGSINLNEDVNENPILVDVYSPRTSCEKIIDDWLNVVYDNSNNNFTKNYILSGWLYSSKKWTYNPKIYIDLIPGLVDFSSSRDAITQNSRFDKLEILIEKNMEDLLKNYLQKCLDEGTFDERLVIKGIMSWVINRRTSNLKPLGLKITTSSNIEDLIKIDHNSKNKVFELPFSRILDRNKRSSVSSVNPYSNNHSEMIKDLNSSLTELKEIIAKTTESYDVTSIAQFFSKTVRLGKENRLIVITNVNETDKAKIFNKSRGYLVNEDLYSEPVVFVPTKKSKAKAKKEISKYFTDKEVSFLTYDEFLLKSKVTSSPQTVKINNSELSLIDLKLTNDEYLDYSTKMTENKLKDIDLNSETIKIIYISNSLLYSVMSIGSTDRRRINNLIHNAYEEFGYDKEVEVIALHKSDARKPIMTEFMSYIKGIVIDSDHTNIPKYLSSFINDNKDKLISEKLDIMDFDERFVILPEVEGYNHSYIKNLDKIKDLIDHKDVNFSDEFKNILGSACEIFEGFERIESLFYFDFDASVTLIKDKNIKELKTKIKLLHEFIKDNLTYYKEFEWRVTNSDKLSVIDKVIITELEKSISI